MPLKFARRRGVLIQPPYPEAQALHQRFQSLGLSKGHRRNNLPRFVKKPVEIEAVQFKGVPSSVRGLCQSHSCYDKNPFPHVHTCHNGQIVALEVGDWIIPEPNGDGFYPCKPDIFEETYDPVDTGETND